MRASEFGACKASVLGRDGYLVFARRIRVETRGSTLFRQTRVARNGRRFDLDKLYKFRAMYVDAESRLPEPMKRNEMAGNVFKMHDNPRITPFGRIPRRHHLDELLQFWNVLKGDMSLVGTRPPTSAEVALYHRIIGARRLSMAPGSPDFGNCAAMAKSATLNKSSGWTAHI